ncbi:MAG: archease [Sedimenticolaceae bacterium]
MEAASAPAWEHFQHMADIGVRGCGVTIAEAFEQAALAMTAVIAEPDSVEAHELIEVDISAPDNELLLTEWLNALIYEVATRHMLFGRFKVEIRDHRLRGKAWGEAIDVARHEPAVEIKGATFTELRVWRGEEGMWHAQCVVDV